MKQIEYSKEAVRKLKEIRKRITFEYGENVADNVITSIVKSIRRVEIFEKSGLSVSGKFGIKSDYRYIYTEKNYVFYRIEDDCVKIINILNENQDFMQILFGVNTVAQEMDDFY